MLATDEIKKWMRPSSDLKYQFEKNCVCFSKIELKLKVMGFVEVKNEQFQTSNPDTAESYSSDLRG